MPNVGQWHAASRCEDQLVKSVSTNTVATDIDLMRSHRSAHVSEGLANCAQERDEDGARWTKHGVTQSCECNCR